MSYGINISENKINKGKKQIHNWPMMAKQINTVDHDREYLVFTVNWNRYLPMLRPKYSRTKCLKFPNISSLVKISVIENGCTQTIFCISLIHISN